MFTEKIRESLVKIGMSSTEAKIYEALLRCGTLKTSEILKEAKINSGRIYDILANLQNKGFISTVQENNIKKFKAAPPHIIEEFLNEQESQIKERQNEISVLMPSLNKIYSENCNPVNVEVYTGKKGMRTAYEILFKEAEKNRQLFVTGTSAQITASWMPLFLETYVYPWRKRLNLKTKKIMNESAKREKRWKGDNSEIRYLPLTAMTSYEILGDVVIVQIAQEDTINLVIRNRQVADDFRAQFELLWKTAKK